MAFVCCFFFLMVSLIVSVAISEIIRCEKKLRIPIIYKPNDSTHVIVDNVMAYEQNICFVIAIQYVFLFHIIIILLIMSDLVKCR